MTPLALSPNPVDILYCDLADRQDMCENKGSIFSEIFVGKRNNFTTPNKIIGSQKIGFVGGSLVGRGMVVDELGLYQDRETVSDLSTRKSTFSRELSCF